MGAVMSESIQERVRRLREEAAAYAESAAGVGRRASREGEDLGPTMQQLALTSIALSLAAEQLTKAAPTDWGALAQALGIVRPPNVVG